MIKVEYVDRKVDISHANLGEFRFVLIQGKSRFVNLDNVMFAETTNEMLYDESGKELGKSTILRVVFPDDYVIYTLLSDELSRVLEVQPNDSVIYEYNFDDFGRTLLKKNENNDICPECQMELTRTTDNGIE